MKVETFRKLIREEVKRALREELPSLLTEINETPRGVAKPGRAFSGLFEEMDQKIKQPVIEPTGNPMLDLINETKMSMLAEGSGEDWKSIGNFDSNNVNSYRAEMMSAFGGAPTVQSVDQMVQTARPAQSVEQVQINAVPDFSKMMGALKQKGKI
jgi:hypothetical protein